MTKAALVVKHLPGRHNQKAHANHTVRQEVILRNLLQLRFGADTKAALGTIEFLNDHGADFDKAIDFYHEISKLATFRADINQRYVLLSGRLNETSQNVAVRLVVGSSSPNSFGVEANLTGLNNYKTIKDDASKVIDYLLKMQELSKTMGAAYIIVGTPSNIRLPFDFLASNGYLAYVNMVHDHIVDAALAFLKNKYDLPLKAADKIQANRLRTIYNTGTRENTLQVPIADLLNIKHPSYPEVSLFAEYLSNNSSRMYPIKRL